MHDGLIVEQGRVGDIFACPRHEYTQRLLEAEPRGRPQPASEAAPDLLSAEDARVWFPIKRGLFKRTVGHVKALDGISLRLKAGHTLGVVGESGSGKSTLGRALLRLTPSQGSIIFGGRELQGLSWGEIRPLRRQMQVVFQDPYGSLSPRLTIGRIVGEGLEIHKLGGRAEQRARVEDVLREVGLDPGAADRYPHEFSGGQRQRIAIARALVLKPDFIVLDEPTSALDVSVQAQIVDLLRDLQIKNRLAYMFISHDLRVVRALADEVIVLRGGKVMEHGPAEQIFNRPQHAYTQALMAAAFNLEAVETGVVKT
jgi:microcin C transport system ATP-binding protein